ncbi:hypothetical protein KUTeg_020953 [Tegillarca granosa]|uniref:Peptidase M20 dimerisation domain-containing protein n=1 Tax=Tegillarca granosa TaxID=220873 RepID=A0ABQ9EC23_TEGGR|nr:hypothetical protein KUTeg_020953 [Tegillarca granosa]
MTFVHSCSSVCLLIFSVLFIIIAIRTWTFSVRVDKVRECRSVDSDFIQATDEVIERFQKALKFQTVSVEPHVYNTSELHQLKEFIKSAFPTIHGSPLVTFEEVANYSLLYTVQGSDGTLAPYFLAAHLDVVPVSPELWDAPPFGAEIRDGFIYARGTIDFKQGVMGILEALEYLLSRGIKPRRSFYIGFGHDEEVNNQVKVGTTEKGQVIIELKVKGEPGHSSMPKKESAISILAKAVVKFLSRKPSTNAITRTVTSVTLIQGGVKVNIIPPEATAYVNHRIHPSQSVQEIIDYDRQIINDERVQIRASYSMEPHPLSPYGDEDFGYQTIKNSIRQVWKEAVVAPGVMIGNTDSRHYIRFTTNIYRFSPTFMFPDDVKRFHGNNERMSVKNYEQVVNFYYHVMMNADQEKLPPFHQHSSEL